MAEPMEHAGPRLIRATQASAQQARNIADQLDALVAEIEGLNAQIAMFRDVLDYHRKTICACTEDFDCKVCTALA